MLTLRDILTRITALPDSMGVRKPGDFLSELRTLSQDANRHLKAADALDAVSIRLDKVPPV